jgi:hypothetical protein
MTAELNPKENDGKNVQVKVLGGAGDTVYGLGLIGAWIYYIGRASDFREGLRGFFKAFVWPAILVYEILKLLDSQKSSE